ncbi:SurA N-terminal domain-containing protein [Candidatus Saccharibacteria bacterium]|nr:SurA N-terminal domain-containing protein [Candidatus Saccharibacteria bacterium]
MKLSKKKEKKQSEQEKVEERREEVLATGRKFKYPLQWTKHRIVVNTILITIVITAIIVASGWLALYRLGMTDEPLYRITKIVPISVASVESENVPFSDYLILYRSSITSIERQSGNQFDQSSAEALRAKYKRTALTEAEKYTYATALSKNLNINISDEQVKSEFNRHLKIGGIDRSEEGFLKIIDDNFDLDKGEYEHMLYLSLLKSEVSVAIDEKASRTVSEVEKLLAENDNDYKAVAEQLEGKVIYEETGGLVDSKNIDGGRATEAMKLEPGESSGKFVSMNGDGYYFVKLIKKNNAEVNFVSIKVPFTEFDKRFEALQDEGKIQEFIELQDTDNG